jgi:PTS system nitrogen regulatory IIA component
MRFSQILSAERVFVDSDGSVVRDKKDAIRLLAQMLAPVVELEQAEVDSLLTERESLQSTGIGDGVAIPHASADAAPRQAAAVLVCPLGVPFDAIDGGPVKIIFGVVGPRRATGDHLRTLARISRLLRDGGVRERLAHAATANDAFKLIQVQDEAMG